MTNKLKLKGVRIYLGIRLWEVALFLYMTNVANESEIFKL